MDGIIINSLRTFAGTVTACLELQFKPRVLFRGCIKFPKLIVDELLFDI